MIFQYIPYVGVLSSSFTSSLDDAETEHAWVNLTNLTVDPQVLNHQ